MLFNFKCRCEVKTSYTHFEKHSKSEFIDLCYDCSLLKLEVRVVQMHYSLSL